MWLELMMTNRQAIVVVILIAIAIPFVLFSAIDDPDVIWRAAPAVIVSELVLVGCIAYMYHRIKLGYDDSYEFTKKK